MEREVTIKQLAQPINSVTLLIIKVLPKCFKSTKNKPNYSIHQTNNHYHKNLKFLRKELP